MTSINERLGVIAEDLINLEINTIVDDNIRGAKMPSPRHALIDIGQDYQRKLSMLEIASDDLAKVKALDKQKVGNLSAFDTFRDAANKRINALAPEVEGRGGEAVAIESELFVLLRIMDMSDQIKGMFEDLRRRQQPEHENNLSRSQLIQNDPKWDLTPHQLALIRKAWELGVREIAMQTVVQIDGDVVTRVRSQYANGESPALLDIHQKGISTSVDFWKELIHIVSGFLKGLLNVIGLGK